MANISIRRSHRLGREVARQKVEEIADSLQERLDAQWAWRGDSLTFQRSGASGTVEVGEDYVEFHVKLGLLLSPMKGMIEETIQRQVDEILG